MAIFGVRSLNSRQKFEMQINMKESLAEESTFISLPLRKQGTIIKKFRSIKVHSNNFKLTIKKNPLIYVYRIQFTPEIPQTSRKLRFCLLQQVKPEILKIVKNSMIAINKLYSTSPMKPNFMINLQNYVVSFKEIEKLDKQHPKFLKILSVYFRKAIQSMGFIKNANTCSYINLLSMKQVMNIYIYESFRSSIHNLDGGIYLKVSLNAKVVRNQTVLQIIDKIYIEKNNVSIEERRQIIKNMLVGQIVMTNYGKIRYLKIEDVCFGDVNDVIVESEKKNLPEYFSQRYGVKLSKNRQPLLYVNSHCTHIKTLIPSELCLLTGLPQSIIHKQITTQLQRPIEQRRSKILNFAQKLKDDTQKQKLLQQLEMNLCQNFTQIEANIVPPPKIMFGSNKTAPHGKENNFGYNYFHIFNNSIPIKLAVITIFKTNLDQMIKFFNQTFKLFNLKMKFDIFKTDQVVDQRKALSVMQILERKAKQINQCNFCLIVLPHKFKNLYEGAKKVATEKVNILSQIILDNTPRKKNLKSIASKILLQIAVKSGNTLWASVPPFKKEKTMILGYHCSTKKNAKNQYCIGLCATYDENYSQIFSMTKSFKDLQQIYQKMKELFFQALINYIQINKYLPIDIVLIQKFCKLSIKNLKEYFIEPLIIDLKYKYDDQRPRLSYLHLSICQSDRLLFFTGQNYKNVPAGTLVNNSITEKDQDHFFLVSHNTAQKHLLKPLSYQIIYNDSDSEKGILQSLVHSLCFSYANLAGSVNIPSLLKYAASLVKFDEILEGQAPIEFRKKIYYI